MEQNLYGIFSIATFDYPRVFPGLRCSQHLRATNEDLRQSGPWLGFVSPLMAVSQNADALGFPK